MDLLNDVLQPFAQQISDSRSFQVISQAPNSFEGWLKWELVGWSTRALLGADEFDGNLVGVEARVKLQQCAGQDKDEKLVDFWIDGKDGRYHYVELKIAFGNSNMTKQATLAGWDFWYLATMQPEGKASVIATMIYVQKGADPEKVAEVALGAMSPLRPDHVTLSASGGSWWICHMPWAEAFKAVGGEG